MSDYIIAVSKQNKDVTEESNPNSFIFHSDYNSFKIVKNGLKVCNVVASTNDQEFTVAHGLEFTPLVTAFAKDDAEDMAFPPNTFNINFYFPTLGLEEMSTGVKFTKVGADATNVIFTFDNIDTSDHTINVRYFCLETI
jgi:hypothetical protein